MKVPRPSARHIHVIRAAIMLSDLTFLDGGGGQYLTYPAPNI
jgi:hypothetical protein